MIHKHHLKPKHLGGNNDVSNLLEVTIKDHATIHFAHWIVYGRWQDEIAYKALDGQITQEEANRLANSYRMKGNTLGQGAWSKTKKAKHKQLMIEIQGRKKGIRRGGRPTTYKFISPDDKIIIVDNLAKFCREQNLIEGCMRDVAKLRRRQKSHRGYKHFS